MREWERFSTTAANAYVQPLMARYLRRLEAGCARLGAAAPIFLMLSGGGLTTIETACRFPIRLVESGPAGGAIFSAHIARAMRAASVCCRFDMGGTTAKICLIDDFRPQTSRSFEVARIGRFRKGSGLPLRIPVIEMVEIGAGGGSARQRRRAGPHRRRAGERRRRSGARLLRPRRHRAGGDRRQPAARPLRSAALRRRHDAARCRRAPRTALDRACRRRLGSSPEMAALGVIEMVDENMANAARVHAIESGKTYAGRTLIAFGGGGPVHAMRVAEKIGIDRVLVPSGAGVGSAIGFLRAPVGYEVVRSLYQRFSQLRRRRGERAARRYGARRRAAVVAPAASARRHGETRIAYMRYVGQGHEIPVPLPARVADAGDVAAHPRRLRGANMRASTTARCPARTSRS